MIAQTARPVIDFQQGNHTYRLNGRAVPSVTGILAPLNDWSHVDPLVLATKAADGRDVHAACDLLVREQLDWSSVCNHIRPYVEAAAAFLAEFGGTVIASEAQVASGLLGIAGTLDIVIERGGCLYFIDWKISQICPTTVGPQLAAYEVLFHCTRDAQFRPWHPRPKSKRLCLRLGADGRYKCDWKSAFKVDWNIFTTQVAHWRSEQARYG